MYNNQTIVKAKWQEKNLISNRITFNSVSVDYVMIMLTCYTWTDEARSAGSRWRPWNGDSAFCAIMIAKQLHFFFNFNDILSEKTIYPSQHILVVVSFLFFTFLKAFLDTAPEIFKMVFSFTKPITSFPFLL